MKLQSDLQSLVSALSMDGIAVAYAQWSDALERELLPEEIAHIKGSWGQKRKADFILGRCAARRACKMLGITPLPILRADDDAPAWPEGIIGSIAHCDDIGVSVVSTCGSYQGLGIDFEKRSDRPLKVLGRIANPDEATSAKNSSDPATTALIIFSVKEAVYKALAPICKRYIAFSEVSLLWDDKNLSKIEIQPHKILKEDLSGMHLAAKISLNKHYIASHVWVTKS